MTAWEEKSKGQLHGIVRKDTGEVLVPIAYIVLEPYEVLEGDWVFLTKKPDWTYEFHHIRQTDSGLKVTHWVPPVATGGVPWEYLGRGRVYHEQFGRYTADGEKL